MESPFKYTVPESNSSAEASWSEATRKHIEKMRENDPQAYAHFMNRIKQQEMQTPPGFDGKTSAQDRRTGM